MNILVTGANGQLGNELRVVTCGSADNYIFTDVIEASDESIAMLHKLAGSDVDARTVKLDITDIEAIRKMVRGNDVKVIVNCAAYTNVDKAESDFEMAELLNAKAPQNLAMAMSEVGGLLVHISTDYVFGKEPYNTPCREDQKGTPTGVYGLTKLHGEQNILASGCEYIIIRTAWLYSEFGKNFVRTMLNLTATKPELKVVFDQVGTPTYAGDLAGAIKLIIERYGTLKTNSQFSTLNSQFNTVYHYSNEGVCSWFDFTKMIAEMAGNTECVIAPCHSEEFPSPVKRPSFSVLDKTKIKQTFGISVPYWTQPLRNCIKNLSV
jgi:dTDP-4-dehydrorhamnose reductase